jgi:hypothetical protein
MPQLQRGWLVGYMHKGIVFLDVGLQSHLRMKPAR